MKLLIVIPALNEEASIQSIIARCLAARAHIIATSPVDELEITVVSDGSTDRTVELASAYADQVNLIVFEKNRGYGAAIKEAWRRSDAELLGFLDADGTCEPRFFSELCNTAVTEKADVVLGSRLSKGSRMPVVRRVGNFLFAALLRVLSSAPVRDTASGMRVVRRQSLDRLFPLPDGLHFTPAMSARALLSRTVRIVEIDMPYAERQGASKLRIVKDGFRFLRVTVETALLYRPSRALWLAAMVSLALPIALMLTPTAYYASHRAVQEWMIYRFVVSHLLGTTACLLFCASYLTGRIVAVTLPGAPPGVGFERALERFFRSRGFWMVPAVLLIGGTALVLPSFLELVKTGATYEHWSRFVAMSFCWSVALILIVTWIVDHVLSLVVAELAYIAARVGSAASPDGDER